jgi:flagellar basal-body rod protein FlgG
MLAAFAVLALAQLASIQLMLLANRGGASAATTFEPIEIQIAEVQPNGQPSRQEFDSELEMTGNSFDWAIDGHGYYQLKLEDGSIGYTRNSTFRCDADGLIVTKDGFKLASHIGLDSSFLSLLVHYNGEISTTQGDGTVMSVGGVQLARFMNPDGLREWRTAGIFFETEESGSPTIGIPGEHGFGTIEQGFRRVESIDQAPGFTVIIAPGREPIVHSSYASDAEESFRTSRLYR